LVYGIHAADMLLRIPFCAPRCACRPGVAMIEFVWESAYRNLMEPGPGDPEIPFPEPGPPPPDLPPHQPPGAPPLPGPGDPIPTREPHPAPN